jgi:L-threonylcarbamoyladenylate synthase
MSNDTQRNAEILTTEKTELFQAAVARAVELLKAGELAALPTETVYGLAANALNPTAVARIFNVKGRPAHNPIIVHVSSIAMARRCVSDWPELAQKLAEAFWPGPLTLVLPRAPIIPDLVTAGGPTVGVRWPRHPVIQAVIAACDFPLAAPSANLSNRVSPTTAAHVVNSIGRKLKLIVDGGPAQIGIESTVLDLTSVPPRVLRPGMIHAESLAAVVGDLVLSENPDTDKSAGTKGQKRNPPVLLSPGQLETHYSPKAKLVERSWQNDQDLHDQTEKLKSKPDKVHILVRQNIPGDQTGLRVWVLPQDPAGFARAIYSALHRCDDLGAEWIVVETLPKTGSWQAIADRLRRAAIKNPLTH